MKANEDAAAKYLSLMTTERSIVKSHVALLHRTLMLNFRKHLDVCKPAAKHDVVDLQAMYVDAKSICPENEELMRRCNSEEAKKLKTAWMLVVNDHSLVSEMADTFVVPKLEYLDAVFKEIENELEGEVIEQDYEVNHKFVHQSQWLHVSKMARSEMAANKKMASQWLAEKE